MTIMSVDELFSDGQAITVDAVSTNVIDRGAAGTMPNGAAVPRDLGKGHTVPLTIQVTTDFAGLSALTVEYETSPDNATWTMKARSALVPAAELVPGFIFDLDRVPIGTEDRYHRLNYNINGTATAGAITAGFSAGNAQ